MGRVYISKSDYMLYLKHPAWLWVKKNAPDKIPPVDAATQAMFDAGHAFEPYVESLFDDGQTVVWDKSDWQSYRTLPMRTQQALDAGAQVLFQGRFEWQEFTFLPDIIEVVQGKTLNLYEIKSSTRVKPEHIYDLAFQKTVLEQLGYTVQGVTVVHINNQYERRGAVDPRQLTTFSDVTEQVGEVAPKTLQLMRQALRTAQASEMPDPDPAHARLGSRPDWRKIYDNIFPPTPTVWPVDMQPTVDRPEIKRFLGELEYPLYFFDYETMQGMVPYFDGQRPYQQVPFQFSLHSIRHPGAEPEHVEYLHTDNSNPAPAVAEQLVRSVGAQGSIITWNMSFEKSVNTTLGRMFPEYTEQMERINERVVDLMVPFKARWYDDPRFEGSASIKNVLPVVCPDLSYAGLGIQDGNSAQRAWMSVVLDGEREVERERVLGDLVEYCKLDTLAMVEIYKKLKEV